MRSFFTDNVNSILGAVSLHLMVIIAFLWIKLGEVNKLDNPKEQVMIEFNPEITPPEEQKSEKTYAEEKEALGGAMASLDQRTLHNIATNVSNKLDPEINTKNYEKQVMQELGISSLQSPGTGMEKSEQEKTADENALSEANKITRTSDNEFSVPNVLRKDNTTVSYFLEGRWHRYIYIPTYKCQGGGTVIMDIVINQAGRVISAIIAENKSTTDECLRGEAYHSAITSQFNADPKASAKQLGTMTYVFLAQ